jgi:hypothetical protein
MIDKIFNIPYFLYCKAPLIVGMVNAILKYNFYPTTLTN